LHRHNVIFSKRGVEAGEGERRGRDREGRVVGGVGKEMPMAAVCQDNVDDQDENEMSRVELS